MDHRQQQLDKSVSIGYTGFAEMNGAGAFCLSPPNHIIYGQNALSHEDSRPAIRLSNGGHHAGGRFAMEQERWKDIVGYEGLYQVSNWGRVKGLDRVIIRSDGRTRTVLGVVLSQYQIPSGYPTVGLRRGGGQATKYVHRLVLQAFCGDPETGQECNHRDGNKTTNRLDNLEWVTHSENERHAYDSGLRGKLTPEIAKMIREICAEGQYTQIEVGLMFGVTDTTIGRIAHGKIWPNAGGPITKRGRGWKREAES